MGRKQVGVNRWSSVLNKGLRNTCQFSTGVYLHGNIYYIPCNSNVIGVLSTVENTFSAINVCPSIKGNYKFSGAIVVGQHIYCIPCNVDEIGLINIVTRSFSTISLDTIVNGNGKFI